MSTIKNLAAANDILNAYISPQRTKYTLDTMHVLMDFLGNPQNRLQVIHVAGTSGKTSTSYYIASLLHCAGYKVGLTVSPHIMAVNERIQIDMLPLEEQEFCAMLAEFLELVQACSVRPSYFELLVAFAYWTFDKLSIDYAVVEVGLGGLLDGTNVVDSPDKICVITDIGLDHVEILGNDIASVAAQKAGIVHAGNHVFMHSQPEPVIKIVKNICAKKKAVLHVVEETSLKLSLPAFQNRNLSLARAVSEFVFGGVGAKLAPREIEQTARIVIPGRLEVFVRESRSIILDGAHNAQKTGALVDSLHHLYPGRKMPILVSFGANKISSVKASLNLLHEIGDEIIITEFISGQDEYRKAIAAQELTSLARDIGYSKIVANPDLNQSFDLLKTRSENVCLVAGSLYLVSQIRTLLLANDGWRNV